MKRSALKVSLCLYFFPESEGNGALILGFTFQEMAARFARGCRNERVNKSTINCEDCLYFIHLDIFCCDSRGPRYVLGRDEDLDAPNKIKRTSRTPTYSPAVRALINSQKTCCHSSARCLIASRSNIRLASHPKSFCG